MPRLAEISYALALALTASAALAGELTAERRAELRHLVLQDCGSCHGMTLKGGLGKAMRPADLADFEEADLAGLILDGVPGTPMPAWRGLVSAHEAAWIARALKTGDMK